MYSINTSAKKILAISLFCLVSLIVNAQQNFEVKVNQKKAVLSSDIVHWYEDNIPNQGNQNQLVILHFSKLPNAEQKLNLASKHIVLLEFLSDNLYSAWLNVNSKLSPDLFIDGIAKFSPEYKIASSIQEKSATQKTLKIFVSFHQGISSTQILELASRNAAALVPNNWQKKGLYTFTISAANLNIFAADYAVKYISEAPQNIPLDIDGKGAEGASILNLPNTLGGKGLRGKDVVVGHGDNCSGIYHIDQSDRVINYNNGDITSHGVLVHGLIGGDGIIDPAGQGIATDGTCISLFFDAVILLKEELFKGFNATLTNNSYAAVVGNCTYSGTYDALSQNLDSMAFKTTEQLDVFAAGNDGGLVCGPYPAGYYNICGGFQTAKNILTVGSTSRNYIVAGSSSRGPLKDGRLKPEITAPGNVIYCPVPNNTYTYTSGTSLACPQATGVLALITERYKQLHSNLNPKSDLLKAIVVNGASDLGRPGPDYWYGFGFLNGVRSIDILENNRYTRNSIASGAAPQTFTVSVPANTAQLKVLLYYHDPAASASASKQLVNDLDLTVTEPGGSVVHQPLILNPLVAGVANNAVEGADHLNNIEQVTINNPTAGTYTVSVSDYAIPSGPQDYVVTYDFIPNEMKLLYPMANTSAPANTDMYIYWDAPDDPVNTIKLEYSTNSGATWSLINAAVPANTRYYQWAVPLINSNQCKVRVSRPTMNVESGLFVINQQPIVSLASSQCPGSIAINWSNVPSATKYYMLLKKGPHFQKVDSVAAGVLTYKFQGLKTNVDYYVSVMPSFVGEMDGFRSKALMRRPNTGLCSSLTPIGDLALEAIIGPENGRRYTAKELKTNTPIMVQVRNQDNFPVGNYTVSYKVNAGPWKTSPLFSITPNTTAQPVIDTYDFSDTIDYVITAVVQNNVTPDPVSANDTLVKVIKQIPNNPITLLTPLSNGFESLADITMLNDTVGLTKDGYWDFINSNDTGRLRTRIPCSKLVKTNRSISMDVNMNNKRNVNYFIGTFNLTNYDTTADEVRFDFEYEMRGMPKLKDSNKVWVRGNDQLEWIPAYTYDNTIDTAKLHQSGTISFRELFRKNGQNFSKSTQIRFGQFDSTVIVDDNYGGGLTIDNVNLYKVIKDVQLTGIVTPISSDCDISNSPVVIKIKNGTTNPMFGIMVAYSIDGKPAVIENITTPLAGDDSINYTFTTGLSGLTFGAHSLKVWLHASGDDYLNNDTIASYNFNISPLVNSFPYLQNFENNNGDWYPAGRNASWAYGVPNSAKINKAASGTKVWKTNLNGNYNSNEQSYLISPCINTIALSNPMLSFSMAYDIENCATGCDRAFIEYSTDNEKTWTRLGAKGQGTNWYNDSSNVWIGENSRWHVASILLPRALQLKLRFGINSDNGTNYEGVTIDDIHIFDYKNPIVNLTATQSSIAESLNVSGTTWLNFLNNNDILASINAKGVNIGAAQSSVYAHNLMQDPVSRQYVMPRNYVLSAATANTNLLRLYITDAEVNKVWSDTLCKTCTKAIDIYRTGITQYTDTNSKNEDSTLYNNNRIMNTYYPYSVIKWVPYDNGYYAEFESNKLGEFWLNDGGVLGSLPANTEYVVLTSRKLNDNQAELKWNCPIDTQMNKFQIQRSLDSVNFVSVKDIPSVKNVTNAYIQLDNPNPNNNAIVYYRLFCTALNGKTFYSNTTSVQWSKGDQLVSIFPNPFTDGNINIKWTGAVGSQAEISINDALGKQILQTRLTSQSWTNLHTIDLSGLAKGVYFLKLNIGKNEYRERIIFK